MKRLILSLVGILMISSVYATGSSFHIKLTGAKNTDYIYFDHVGAVNINVGVKGRSFPLHTGEVNRIILVDWKTRQYYPQNLPSSCKIQVGANNKVTIFGKVSKTKNDMVINHLRCVVS